MLELPLGALPHQDGPAAGGGPGAARLPGFGASTIRKLRATEARLTGALADRSRETLPNSVADTGILKRAALVHKLGLDRVVQLPGMKRQMKAVLETYNAKHPGMDARMFSSLQHATRTATRTLEPGQTLRGLAMQNAYHAVAVEFRCHADRRISAIVLDSSPPLRDPIAERAGMSGFADVLGGRHNRGGRVDAALYCKLGVQLDGSSCAGFTKDFLKELHRHGDTFTGLHADTRGWASGPARQLPRGISQHPGDAPLCVLATGQSQDFLPLSLFKNVQNPRRLAEIANSRPGVMEEPINSRGETLHGRLQRLTGRTYIQEGRDGYFSNWVHTWDNVAPMAENYRRMHRKAAEYGETGNPGSVSL